MSANAFHRLHALRMENDAAGYHLEELRPRFERLAARHENGAAPRAVSAFQLFQTPEPIAARLVALAAPRAGCRVLEPSAGLGRLVRAVLPFGPSKLTVVEVAPQCAAELYRLEAEGLTLLQRDFLTVTPEETGAFDLVLMNPPFHLRSDIRHIQHARQFLAPGGCLAAICMDTPHRRKAFADAAEWHDLPAGTFAAEGTRVPCGMILYRA